MTESGAAGPAAPDAAGDGATLWRLGAGVFAVRIEAEVVWLDVERDTYSIVFDPQRAIRLAPVAGALAVLDEALAATLSEAGFITHADPGRGRSRPPPPVGRSLGTDLHVKPRFSELRDFARLMVAAPRAHRLGALSALLGWAVASRPAAPGSEAATVRRAQVFAALLAVAPVRGDCLFRSHLLLRFLRLGGCDARWVFAVRTWPFAAHCWLQRGDLVLNDTPDRLLAFHPVASF